MQYLLLIHSEEGAFERLPKDVAAKGMADYEAYTEALRKAKILISSNRLRPSAVSSTVRYEGDKVRVKDGPFAETKEQIGGYYLIDVPDLDAALKWAGKCPGARHGAVEVRPVWG
ncbi:MAG: YciI family protein [Hyphomicrobiales bacterium]|nr:MAG: YciI family protein [Hyphomicrobiales bacterium]